MELQDHRKTKRLSASNPGGEFSAEFDYVAVFPLKAKPEDPAVQSELCKHFCAQLLHAKLELFAYVSCQEDELIVLINCPDEVLRAFADKVDYEMELDPAIARKLMESGNKEGRIAPVKIQKLTDVSQLDPYEYIYGKFDDEIEDKSGLYKRQDGELFSDATKLKIIYALIQGPVRLGGCALPIGKLLKKGELVGFYPLHVKDLTTKLQSKMTAFCSTPWGMPFDDIRQYYGEKVSL